MKGYIKKLLREGLDFDFDDENHGKIINTKFSNKNINLTLFRGLRNLFDNTQDNPELVVHGDEYKLDVDMYPDKLIWFTDDETFATKYNGWGIITYQLPAIKHIKTITYEDGYTINTIIDLNDEIESGYNRGLIKADPYKLNHFYRGIELPDHWFWSYKTEKHIVCDTDLIITQNNIKINR